MRFQAVERVSSADAERALVVLEQQLRKRIGADVEREGARIILTGLGPSPRTINPRDTTVIDVRAEDGVTLIDADVNFQASALAGPVGQEEIVRRKLMRVFGAARQQLEEEQDWLETERRERMEAAQSSSGASTISSSSARIYTGPRRFDESSGQHAVRAAVHQTTNHAAQEKVEEQQPAVQVVAEEVTAPTEEMVATLVAVPGAEAPVAEVKDKALPEVKSSDVAAHEADNAAMGQSQPKSERASTSSQQTHVRNDIKSFSGAQPAKKDAEPNRPWMRWAAIAACAVAMVPFAWRLRPSTQAAPVIDLTQSAAPKLVPVGDTGPEGALRQWELALRSTDASAQTAYYAVPVEQYMWKHNVNRRDLQAMKQQEIIKRRGLWTVKVEDVDIQRKGSTATVTLVKHTMEQPQGGGKVRERLVHSQLTLKNSLGIWWITSERDIYPKKVATDDGDNFDPNEGETPSWAKPAPASVATSTTPTSPSTN